jgi:tetratricopeptide (TPR) repeat protein
VAGNRARYAEAVRKGTEFNANAQWKEAIAAYRIAISEFPNQPEAYAGLGQACMGQKQLDRALECYKLAARYSRGDVQYLTKVADIQERMGQLSEAGRTYMAVGEVYLRKRDPDAAISNWERAVRLEPNLLGAHQRLAMIFQRKNNTKAAVREYLAIARTLAMQGENRKALQMCRAAMRLDPDNADVLTAIKLIKQGEEAYPEPEMDEPEPEPTPEPQEEGESLIDAVRQMAAVLESEKKGWNLAQAPQDQLSAAKQLAQEQLAEEIFREEEDEELLYGTGEGLSKLERDALIGQAMDFETRGETAKAIRCYEQVVSGDFELPAAHYALGVLYLHSGNRSKAEHAFAKAIHEKRFAPAVQALLG